jgi:hypothetical protein
MRGIFHRLEVIEVTEELVEAEDSRQELIEVAEMVLTELTRGITHGLEHRSNGHRLWGYTDWRTGLADRGQTRADRELAGDEVSAAGRAACLGVVVSEVHALSGELVEVRRPICHHALVVGANIPDANVVAHDDDDVRWCCACPGMDALQSAATAVATPRPRATRLDFIHRLRGTQPWRSRELTGSAHQDGAAEYSYRCFRRSLELMTRPLMAGR